MKTLLGFLLTLFISGQAYAIYVENKDGEWLTSQELLIEGTLIGVSSYKEGNNIRDNVDDSMTKQLLTIVYEGKLYYCVVGFEEALCTMPNSGQRVMDFSSTKSRH